MVALACELLPPTPCQAATSVGAAQDQSAVEAEEAICLRTRFLRDNPLVMKRLSMDLLPLMPQVRPPHAAPAQGSARCCG